MAKAHKKWSVRSMLALPSKINTKRTLVLMALVLVAVVGVKSYLHQKTTNNESAIEQANYAKLDTQMKSVMAQLSAEVGAPYELHSTKTCSRTSAKFNQGQMTCGIFYNFFYQESSVAEGKNLTLKALSVIEQTASSSSSTPDDAENTGREFTFYGATDNKKIGCDFNYYLSDKKLHNDILGDGFSKPTDLNYAAEYSYNCGGSVVKPFYPVSKE